MAVASKKVIALFLVCAGLLAGGFSFYSYYPMSADSLNAGTEVHIGSAVVKVEVENTPAARELGLSGRSSLAEGSGMLFVFEQEGAHGFWMKDMSFAIDIIFAKTDGRIVTIAHDATPESYTANPPVVFYPSEPALYVLEVPAGYAAEHGIEEGMTLQLK